jgi:GntR family transcriptional regulator
MRVAGLYERIAAELRAQILSGEFAPGDRLPTEVELTEQYSVSKNTARSAVRQLVDEGLIVRVPGRSGGMVIRERVTLMYYASRADEPDGLRSESECYFADTRRQGHAPSQTFQLQVVQLEKAIASRLEQDTGAAAVLRRCVRSADGEPTSIQDTYYPMDLAEEVKELLTPTDIAEGTTRMLAERGHLLVAFRDEIEAHMPTPEDAQLLQLRAGTPILRSVRTARTRDRVARVTATTFAGDRNTIVYTLGETALLDDPPR